MISPKTLIGTQTAISTGALALLLLTMVGCGGSDVPELHKLQGTVTHGGNPVSGVTVVFSPSNGKRPSYGPADKDGHFVMSNTTTGDGVQVGENTVSLMPADETPDTPAPSKELAALLAKYSAKESTFKVTIDSDQDNYELKLE